MCGLMSDLEDTVLRVTECGQQVEDPLELMVLLLGGGQTGEGSLLGSRPILGESFKAVSTRWGQRDVWLQKWSLL